MSFLGGFEAVEPRTSGFFKLKKIRTLEKDMPRKSFVIQSCYSYYSIIQKDAIIKILTIKK
ncbi:hypothetical protein A2641_02825 [Candidatus Nomurabacteria bacterium RIFCSPHIGHO2_01_FULL_37_25]|uniref:Uncharacterized protein n=1 Tax=Candidatus Nomurabacteria bacterium RIFCSPLOWO2_01_FULL_36_16 TaxID=1801767 RepID=A0A1F6X0M3_9BACT|nr:MAG: hypothetical protein A2641_02825 [Candidatus Nomurabacteria bacterium RIFCSPHIGHO2_01_FULL_37_25]OGI75083.1 MAG: hypothetical protein A3D36_03570 [Candidatus Nomurabacteria bacterium RIFCSPHIGHO2_02_FULL_36_29]OGI87594.1 MAG: hypothetical protein A3A91_01640 [Candidatus Nomurabacteria bacterium RIFCSPLOWO2_01_FULL_36_16]OGI96229.1 MAG: hypothetical protein A3I84_02985 [Candidatus Nomurabacteria bacterium RIFCSPLOWO2_02_FULL_36_8]